MSCALLTDNGERVDIDHRGGEGHEGGVETVEHTTMTGQDITAVLDVDGALEQTLHQVTPGAEDHNHQS